MQRTETSRKIPNFKRIEYILVANMTYYTRLSFLDWATVVCFKAYCPCFRSPLMVV